MTAARTRAVVATFCLATITLSQGRGAPPSSMAGSPVQQPVYVVFFEEKPLATYRGTIPGLAATHPRILGQGRVPDP